MLFQEMLRDRAVGDLPASLDLDTKWKLVAEHLRVTANAKRNTAYSSSANGVPEKGSPAWYLRKFIDQSITAKEVSGLSVNLRTGVAE